MGAGVTEIDKKNIAGQKQILVHLYNNFWPCPGNCRPPVVPLEHVQQDGCPTEWGLTTDYSGRVSCMFSSSRLSFRFSFYVFFKFLNNRKMLQTKVTAPVMCQCVIGVNNKKEFLFVQWRRNQRLTHGHGIQTSAPSNLPHMPQIRSDYCPLQQTTLHSSLTLRSWSLPSLWGRVRL